LMEYSEQAMMQFSTQLQRKQHSVILGTSPI
jgi:hypothetical protein